MISLGSQPRYLNLYKHSSWPVRWIFLDPSIPWAHIRTNGASKAPQHWLNINSIRVQMFLKTLLVRPLCGIWRGKPAQCRSGGENTLIKVATRQLSTMTFPGRCTIRADSHWKRLQPSRDYHQTFAHTLCPLPGVLTSGQPITTKHHIEPMQVFGSRESPPSYLL